MKLVSRCEASVLFTSSIENSIFEGDLTERSSEFAEVGIRVRLMPRTSRVVYA